MPERATTCGEENCALVLAYTDENTIDTVSSDHRMGFDGRGLT